mmetsp:Transcript_24467/g.56340  ORF Transcript_24467/g.56340 Transcript_24467/m.56340 type:complete len:773 (+) Transcript_24467:67-2385(+)
MPPKSRGLLWNWHRGPAFVVLALVVVSLWCVLHISAIQATIHGGVLSSPHQDGDFLPPLSKEPWDSFHKLAYIMILSADGDKYRDRRTLLRNSWLKWVIDGEFRGIVDYGFHVMLCADRAADDALVNALHEEWKQNTDLTIHRSPYRTKQIVLDNRNYEFCGLEAEHRLQVSEHVLSMPVKYSFITTADDDGILCMPAYVKDLRMLPRSNLIWGKFWCKLKVVRPDSNWITFSTDLLQRLTASLRDWGLKPIAPQPGYPPSTPEELGERLPFGIAIARILVYYMQDLGERIFVLDDRERIDTQQDWVITHLQGEGSSFPKSKKYAEIADIFRNSICQRLVWVHRATDPDLVMKAYATARDNNHMAFITARSLSLSPADVCSFSRRLPRSLPDLHAANASEAYSWDGGKRQWASFKSHPACRHQLESDGFEDYEWIEELCAHRFIFLRGHFAAGLETLRSTISSGVESILSVHGDHDWVPKVPRHEGQYFQLMWPWDKPAFMRTCFCGCKSDADWACWYLCPLRAKDWATKGRAKQLFYSWRLFWDMTKPYQLEMSTEMGAMHLEQFFPEVSTVVFLMRHPLAMNTAITGLACSLNMTTLDACVAEWLVMWSRTPKKSLVVRLENLFLQPEFVQVVIQRQLGLTSALAEIHGLREDSPPTILAQDMVYLAERKVLWTDGGLGGDAANVASRCLANSSCTWPQLSERKLVQDMGYELLRPADSLLGQGWPFVDLAPLRDTPLVHEKLAACSNRRNEKCQKASGWLSQFRSTCDN